MYRLIYTTGIALYTGAIHAASLWNRKARQWVQGRRGNLDHIREALDPSKPVIWMHCASLGEFEQGRPILEAIKAQYPGYQILLTFFSPSGYEVRNDYEQATAVAYLPPDFPGKANRFIETIHPALVIFIKYEFWLNHLAVLAEKEIPHILVAARFDPHQPFFRWYGRGFREALRQFSHIFVQDPQSAMLLKNQGVQAVTVAGDPRFDRVIAVKNQSQHIPDVEIFGADHKVLVAGSTWPADETMLAKWKQTEASAGWKLIMAPHEVDESHIRQIQERFPTASRYSKDPQSESEVLIVDTIGLLSALYRYADVAYVGGGFGKGIHNVLEAAVYGIPVVTGPAIKGVREAVQLQQKGGLFVTKDEPDAIQLLSNLAKDEISRQQAGLAAGEFVAQNQGATPKVMDWIDKQLS